MCGIIGYIGGRDAQPILLKGIKRLEYRGYDSAGISGIVDGVIQTVKTPGKIATLVKALRTQPICCTTGIAHTRWATHGEPSMINAHPHLNEGGTISVIHNGIIENFHQLRRWLQEKHGITFRSETDSEILAHLISVFYGSSLEEAVRSALQEVRGTYGIAVISSRESDKIVGARNGSPIVIGIRDGERFIASDATAIVEHTKEVIYLDDKEMVILTSDSHRVSKVTNGDTIERPTATIDWDLEALEKGGHPHFMRKEIFEQPLSITDTLRGRVRPDEGIIHLGGLNIVEDDLREINRIIITACGTSWHAALIGEYWFEELARIPVEVEYASEFRYRRPIVDNHTLVIVISQSGETLDTLEAMREAERNGATAIGICNVVGSTIARETDGGVYTHAGPEIGVASTKAFTAQLSVLATMSLLLAQLHGRISDEERIRIAHELVAIPEKVQAILNRAHVIEQIARHYAGLNNFLYLGRGVNFPVALEGALKLKEISYIHAEGYPAAEMKHGPIALIDRNMPVVFIALRDGAYDKILGNMEEVRSRHGQIIALVTEGDERAAGLAQHVIEIPETHNMLTPMLSVIPLQLLAYHIAVIRGCDVDQPRNLAKSVTVE